MDSLHIHEDIASRQMTSTTKSMIDDRSLESAFFMNIMKVNKVNKVNKDITHTENGQFAYP